MLKSKLSIILSLSFLLIPIISCFAGNIAQPFSDDPSVQPVINTPTGINQLNNVDADSLAIMLINARNWFAGIVLIFSTISVLIGAFLYMTSGGDPKKTQRALGWIKGAVIGVLIAVISFGIVSLVVNTIGGLSTGGSSGGGNTPAVPPWTAPPRLPI